MKLLLLADQRVGYEILRWLIAEYVDDIALVVTTSDNELAEAARGARVPHDLFVSADELCGRLGHMRFDLGVLAWWPAILRGPVLQLPAHGFINTHPSLLPYNRGKHYNFWAIVEQAPFGVTLHFVDAGIDSGDIVAQQAIPYGWEDTGGTLYARAQNAMVELFQREYPRLRTLDIPRVKQAGDRGSFHRAAELDAASRIDLDARYRAADLLNLLRARTFPPHPACWFRDADAEYEVRIDITKKQR